MKFREILKGTILENRLNILIEDAHKWLRDLGKNDFIHSNNIEDNLDRLVPDEIKLNENIFDKAEIFLLLYAVYLHDIGRYEDGDHHEKDTYQKIMENPEKYGLKNEFEAYAVAEICYGHAKESEKPIKSIRPDYGIAGLSNKVLNLQFLAALLRLADEVDNAYTRVQGIKKQKGSVRNLIRFINFDTTRWIIEFQSQPANWKDRTELRKIQSYTQSRLDEIREILETKELLYYQIWLDPKDFSKIQTPRPKDIELKELKQFVGNLISQQPFYDKQFHFHIVDIYFEEKIKGQSYRNAVFVNKEICEDSIYEFKEIFNNLRNNNEIEHGFIVVEKISKEICKLANEEKIKIITVYELIQEVANFSEYLKNYVKNYEDTPIFKKDCYIPLTANLETKENVGTIDDYLEKWLRLEGQLQLTVLGDYGTGKSTVAKRLEYQQAKRYLENPAKERIPVLIELKIYQKSISIESLITDLLINKYSVEIKNFNTFKLLNESGKLLLILDGFDEMASRVDKKVTLANFREFDKLISENSKVILTCRTHYFKNQDEIHKLHQGTEIYNKIDEKGGYTLLFLNPLKEEDFVIYLKKFFPENWEKYHQTIINTYNLRELAEKPILLELMVQTLPQIKIEENEKLNHASLYDRYTKFWLNRDDWRSYLESIEREFITEEIAFYLFINNKDRIFYEELPKLIQEKFPAKRNFEMEYLDQDVRTCTFLNRDEKGDYSFVHQSFMEFFVAKQFAREIKNKKPNNFKLKKLSPEIAGFLMNMAKDAPETYLFSWDEIPGKDDERLLEFLKQNFDGNWEMAKIKKTHNNTIIVSNEISSLSLKLNNEKTNVNLTINGVRAYEFNVKMEMDKLNLYVEILYEFLKSTKNKTFDEVKYLGGNSATILNLQGKNFNELDLSSTVLVGANFNNANLIKSNLSNTAFSNVQKESKVDRVYETIDFDESRVYRLEKNLEYFANHLRTSIRKINRLKARKTPGFENELQAINKELMSDFIRIKDFKDFNPPIFEELDKKMNNFNENILILDEILLSNIEKYLYELNLKLDNSKKEILLESNIYFEKEIKRESVLTTFFRANLKGADLSNSDLRNVDLREANLIGAKLIGAHMNGANLTGAVR